MSRIRIRAALVLALMLSPLACKLSVKGNQPAPQPLACSREVATVPAAFAQVATQMAGAVKNAQCETIAVGTTSDGEPIVAKYDASGSLVTSYAQGAGYQPFATKFRQRLFNVKRIGVMNEGFLVFASYGKSKTTSNFFAFRLTDEGYLDSSFGPLKDGVVREELLDGVSLTAIDSPIPEGDFVGVNLSYYDAVSSSTTQKLLRFPANGRAPMTARFYDIPADCSQLNFATVTAEGANLEFAQSSCTETQLRYDGGPTMEDIKIPMDGSVVKSQYFGEFSMHYQDMLRIATLRDHLGNVRSEYISMVRGISKVCGRTVTDLEKSYLVFSALPPTDSSWLNHCWTP